MDKLELKKHARNVRKKIIEMVYAAQSGHPGGSLSAADILTYLYYEVMDVNKDNLESKDRDRFVLSKGHASPALYGILDEMGLLEEDITSFRQIGSKLQGHPSMEFLKGVDMSTGSLGQGASVAVGMALANKLDGVPYRVYCLVGDGECQEGLVWEALMAAHNYHLNNLVYILDYNDLQIDGRIEEVMDPTPFKEKFEAFGLRVYECDGHDFDDIESVFKVIDQDDDRPSMIIAHTVKGKGVSFMEGQVQWHGVAPNAEQYQEAMAELSGEVI